MSFSSDGIHIRFPTTRRLAEYLEVPHYYILPYFAMMEEQELVTRAERVGILTTNKGTDRLIAVMRDLHPQESAAVLGEKIFAEIAGPRKESCWPYYTFKWDENLISLLADYTCLSLLVMTGENHWLAFFPLTENNSFTLSYQCHSINGEILLVISPQVRYLKKTRWFQEKKKTWYKERIKYRVTNKRGWVLSIFQVV